MSETVRVNISVSSELHTYYKEQAERAGVSMSAYMAIALQKYMDHNTHFEKGNKNQSINLL
ncbi:hypothetical protein A8L34_29650 [Bacillus sp. FJAT-27264]|uniref:hypothetical protein n=1 Tax=Paenibacillus sp. (strain DSM 101736 / FJAT-27264) TaxID=1850362 RepID=UPI000807A733|nr:hypothetical protein [Bacillus sp. FJAT-27264]OBZ12904.1 hypothetical protein A8L34_29650 [Bacillus sp. FJAT-27264]